jgi:diguanylate cyclase (GGDEF)-like protein
MIENLCLAAEITAGLILLSMGTLRSRSSDDEVGSNNAVDSETLSKVESVVETLQLLSLWAVSQNRRHSELEGDDSTSSSSMLGSYMLEIGRLVSPTRIDEMTGLHGRDSLERLLATATPWLPSMRHSIQVALLQIDGLDQIEELHGTIAAERTIQQTGRKIHELFGGNGWIVRHGFHSFAIAVVGRPQIQTVKLIESLRGCLGATPVTVNELELKRTCSAAMATYSPAQELEYLWSQVEDGLAQSVAEGGDRGFYFDNADSNWKPMNLAVSLEVTEETNETIGETTNDQKSTEDTSSDKQSVVDTLETSLGQDVDPKSDSASQGDAAEAPVEAASEKVSEDDISALFAAALKSSKTSTEAASATVKSGIEVDKVTETPAETKKSDNEVASTVIASADDIAALFASAKTSSGSSDARAVVQSKGEASNDEIDNLSTAAMEIANLVQDEIARPITKAIYEVDERIYDEPALRNDDDLSKKVSENDIAALFAALKK